MSRHGRGRKRGCDDNGWSDHGGYMAAKMSKLDEQFKMDAPTEKQKEGASTKIFSGVAIFVNGYTDPTVDELRRLMQVHGGQFHTYYSRSKTTHIIATNLPNSKIQELRGEKVVRPEWITDSIKAGVLLSYLKYQLYAKQKGLSFPSVCVRQAPETAAGPSLGPPQASLGHPQPSLVSPPDLGQPPAGFHGPPAGHDKFLAHHNHSLDQPLHHHHNPDLPLPHHHHNPDQSLPHHHHNNPDLPLPHHHHNPDQPLPNHHHNPDQSLPHHHHHNPDQPHHHYNPDQTLPHHHHNPDQPLPHHYRNPPDQPLPHHRSPIPSQSPLYPGSYHHPHPHAYSYPGQNNPLADWQLGRLPPGPQPGHLHSDPGLSTRPLGPAQQPAPACVRPPPAYTPPQQPSRHPSAQPEHQSAQPDHQHSRLGRAQPQHSLSSAGHHNQHQHNYHELDFRLNGSLRVSWEQPGSPKANGVQEGDWKDPLSPPRPSRGPKEPLPPVVTNGHVHPVNGALKPLDLSPIAAQPNPSALLGATSDRASNQQPTSGVRHQTLNRLRSPKRKSPGVSVSPRAPSPPSQPLTKPPDPPLRPPDGPPKSSTPPLPATHRHPRENAPQQQHPKPPPPTYEEAIAASESSRPLLLQSHRQKPCQSVSSPEKKTHSSSHSTSPAPSPVRLNGCHRSSAFPPTTTNPAPPEGKDQSAKSQAGGRSVGMISEYYSHSRLHHISTWRTEFSEYVNTLQSRRRAAGGGSFPGKERLRRSSVAHRAAGSLAAPSMQSCILHVDMDCFFVSVGIRHRPELRGKPVAVTSNRGVGHVAQRAGTDPELEQQYYQRKHTYPPPEREDEDLDTPDTDQPVSHGNGVTQDMATLSRAEIASCSYEARQAGVRNGMYFGQARQLCPALQSVPYDFQAYREVALTMYETLASYTHDIEALSCDEALMDGSALLAELCVTPDDLATAIRADVRERTGCSASVGMASNILLARMAIRKAKPDGQYLLRSEEVDDFLREQSVTSLPGVGRSMGGKLASLGVRTCGDLQQVTLPRLQKEFGPRTGQTLYRFCRGLDDRPVRSEKERKSVSAEMNYNIRFTQAEEAESFLTNLSMEVQRRLQGAGLRGRRVTLKVMVRKAGAPVEPAKYGGHGICDNLAKSVTMAQPTDSGPLIAAEVIKLFRAMRLEVEEMRGIGLQVQLLEGAHPHGAAGAKPRSIKDMFLGQQAKPDNNELLHNASAAETTSDQGTASSVRVPPPRPSPSLSPPAEAIPGTSKGEPPPPPRTPNHARTRLNLSIEVPSPSQVDRSVLEALPPELREQVEQSWTLRDRRPSSSSTLHRSLSPPPHPSLAPAPSSPPPSRAPSSSPPPRAPPVGTLVLQIPNQPGQSGSTGIILELPDFSQVDPDVFAALPRELQEELRSAYHRRGNALPAQGAAAAAAEHRNPLLQLKQLGAGVGKVKRRYKKRNAGSPAKKGPSPLKRPRPGSSPAKAPSHTLRSRETPNGLKTDNAASTSSMKQDVPEELSKFTPRPAPALAGACDFTDIRTLLQEWVTTISEPMEEDILQVVKYCTDLIEDKDLEKLDLVIKYMKRLMQQSVESVWSMAFDFILDNVQMVVQQAYGSMLKIT